MCKGQEERERGTEVPRSKRNKNVLAEVAKVAEVLPFLPVQMFIKSGKSDLPEKEDRAVLPAQA